MNASTQYSVLLSLLIGFLTDFRINIVDAKSSIAHKKEYFPEDVGRLHSEVFQRLEEKMAKSRPESVDDIMKEIGFIAASYCKNEDHSCSLEAKNTVWDHFENMPFAGGASAPVVYPDHLDPLVEPHVNSIMDIIQMINEDNLDETLEQIEKIQSDWKMVGPRMDDKTQEWVGMDEVSHKMGLISTSLALESSKLWHNVLFPNKNDDEEEAYHPFQEWVLDNHNLRDRRLDGRSLEGIFNIGSILSSMIIPDVLAALEPFLNFNGNLDEDTVLLIVVPSIAASAVAALGGGTGTDDYYYGDDYYSGGFFDIFDIFNFFGN